MKAAEQAAATRPPPTEPNATASSAVVDEEGNEGAQGLADYPSGQVLGINEGEGQEAEASRTQFTTPSGVRQSDAWRGGRSTDPLAGSPPGASRPDLWDAEAPAGAAGPVQAEEPAAADAAQQQEAEPEPAPASAPQPRRKRTTPKGRTGEQLVQQDPGGGSETGATGADAATPSGAVDEGGAGIQRTARKAARRPKGKAQEQDPPPASAPSDAPKRRGRPKKA